jgi:myo-inositol-1(or 4)-monophosphatase
VSDRDVLRQMLGFVRDAARIAHLHQESARATLKADSTLVTEVDLRISEMALQVFSGIAGPDGVVTEEHDESLNRIIRAGRAPDGELLVVIDPIDGTRNYAHRMPLYGVSVGILRNLVPWIGAVAFPALDEMVYSDGTTAMLGRCITDADRSEEIIPPPAPELTLNSSVLCSDSFLKGHRWDHGTATLLVLGCATIEICWPLLGRGSASLFGAHVWDLAGAWPLIYNLGFTLKGLRSGKEIRRFDWTDYDPTTKKIKELAVMCRPEHFEKIAAGVS